MSRRILIHGVTGTGKSTLAAQLSAHTGIAWYDVDALTWRPGWTQLSELEQRELFTEICAGDRWILDTAYGSWRDVALARCDLIVALDYPRRVSLGRLLRRTAVRIVTRRPVCNGNVETLRRALGPESIVRWHFSTFARKHSTIAAWPDDPSTPPVVRLTTPRATRDWLEVAFPAPADPAAGRRPAAGGPTTDHRDRRRRWVNRVSRVFHLLQRLGIRTGRAQILTTTGRRSGEPRSQPVGVVPIDGSDYIFQAYPRAAWVANARANPSATLATGRRSRRIRLVEQGVERRRELLLRQLRAEPDTGTLLVRSGLVSDPSPEAVAAAADHIAVFRVEDDG